MYGLSGIFTVSSNAPPTASNGSVTTEEDTPYTFAAADFNFADTDSERCAFEREGGDAADRRGAGAG